MSRHDKHQNGEFDVLIVGAGLSGLMAAQVLRDQSLTVVLVDKGRSVGGRLATRRIGPGRADHGAQFFTVRTPEFQDWVKRWLVEEIAFQWSTGWSDGSLFTMPSNGHPRYAVRQGMNALAKHLASKQNVLVDARLVAASVRNHGWRCVTADGRVLLGRSLLLTPPVPQGLALLEAGHTELAAQDRALLGRIRYDPCLCGLFWLDCPPDLPEPGALQQPYAPIAWIADNQRKGISPRATLVTAHASADLSRALWDESESRCLDTILGGMVPFLEPGTRVLESQLKKWRYSIPTVLHQARTLVARKLPPLAFAGDAFGTPRVEGAALSGLAAGGALAARLKDS